MHIGLLVPEGERSVSNDPLVGPSYGGMCALLYFFFSFVDSIIQRDTTDTT